MTKFDADKFEEVVKKSKQKNRKKSILMVVISVVLSIIFVLGILFGIFWMNDRHGYENAKYLEVKTRFMTPNVQTRNLPQSDIGLFNGKNTAEVQKDVDGYPLEWGDITGTYNILSKLGKVDIYSMGGKSYPEGRRMNFFNPNITYKYITADITEKARKENNYTRKQGKNGSSWDVYPDELYEEVKYPNDIANIVKTENRVVEVGISFDKPYTYEEVQKMIPENLVQAWYWVSEGAQTTNKIQKNIYVNETDEDVFARTVTFGYSENSDIKFGDLRLGNYWEGDNGLKPAFDMLKTDYSSEMDKEERKILDGILKNNHLKNKKDMLLNGIVLTGRSENFKQLEGKSWIQAA
ncbi:MAG: anti sigma factor C-terminal domain-containing protein, partial [Pseudolactococcus laudensis]